MDKQQAQALIHDLFSNPFQLENYRHFLRNLLNEYEPRDGHYTGNLIPDAFKAHVKQYWRIGKYVTPEGDELDLLVVQVKNFSKLERARSALRNFAVNRLKQFDKDASLIAFYAEDDNGADWRFSFVKIEHEAYQDDHGKVKLKRELTPAKRYSFLVGEQEHAHTAKQQLLPLLEITDAEPSLENIEAAFSIEKVTDEFFQQYKQLFQKLAEHLKRQAYFQAADDEARDQQVSRFAKKLLGQIVFLYFLQKKGWLGVPKDEAWGKGDKRFMHQRYEQITAAGGRYYHDFLQYLFYQALANERKGQDDPGYYQRFDCRVPFLNGGLFEANYDWQKETIDLPNSLFHNDEKNKAGDKGTGILDVFERYNFTIKEDDPLEKEVAIDPEMLGKVFENMLEVTERKSKGAFYTPREIVHYMCQESLIHYLDNSLNTYAKPSYELGSRQASLFLNEQSAGQLSLTENADNIRVPLADLQTLIRKGRLALENDTRVLGKGKETKDYKFQLPETVRSHAKAIDTALANLKACDPAIGSGAFPVGLLHEIVNTRLALAPHARNEQSPYELKRHAIAESIYGVDIDASAIDIARLRLWLSLIVDEDDYATIAALPNLDYKIVCGNSLIGFPENWKSENFAKIEKLKDEFFQTSEHDKKQVLKQQIDAEIQKRLDNSQAIFGWQVNFDFRLWFSEVWHEKGGFDVVIGNPPYVRHEVIKAFKLTFKQIYGEFFSGTADLYTYFYKRGLVLLKPHGSLCYIAPNKFMRAGYGKNTRSLLVSEAVPRILIDFGDTPVFDATTYPAIILLEKGGATGIPCRTAIIKDKADIQRVTKVVAEQGFSMAISDLPIDGWTLDDPEVLALMKKLRMVGTPLSEYVKGRFYRGVLTGLNDAFVIDAATREHLIEQDPRSEEIIKPWLRGRDVKKWQVEWAGLYVIFTRRGTDIEQYPAIKDYLSQFREDLEPKNKPRQKRGRKSGTYQWFEIQDNIAYYAEFELPKIVYPNITKTNIFAFDTTGVSTNQKCFIIPTDDLYLLAVLNSSLVMQWFIFSLPLLRGDYFEPSAIFMKKLPIYPAAKSQKQPIEKLVQEILNNPQAANVAELEKQLDALIFDLYSLTAAERELVQQKTVVSSAAQKK